MTTWSTTVTPLGAMILAADDGRLVGAWFEGQRHFAGVDPGWAEDADDPVLAAAAAQLEGYFAGARRTFELPLAPVGTAFQIEVWRRIAGIGYGESATYGALAAAVGRSAAARAVGAATGRNPLAVIVPCHRVVGRDGSLTGYAGGLERKRALLGLERGTRLSLR